MHAQVQNQLQHTYSRRVYLCTLEPLAGFPSLSSPSLSTRLRQVLRPPERSTNLPVLTASDKVLMPGEAVAAAAAARVVLVLTAAVAAFAAVGVLAALAFFASPLASAFLAFANNRRQDDLQDRRPPLAAAPLRLRRFAGCRSSLLIRIERHRRFVRLNKVNDWGR